MLFQQPAKPKFGSFGLPLVTPPKIYKTWTPSPLRTFGFHSVSSKEWNELKTGEGYSNDGEYQNQKGTRDPINNSTRSMQEESWFAARGIAGCMANSQIRTSTARPRPAQHSFLQEPQLGYVRQDDKMHRVP
jgi:hypothetical protein